MKKILSLLILLIGSLTSYGAFSIALDAGQLRSNSVTGLPVGSLLIFITAGADGIFQTPSNLSAGNYAAGDDVLLSIMTDTNSASPFNNAGGTNETNSVFAITQVNPPANQLLGFLWFPQITYAQFLTGTVPTAGQTFGFYNPSFYGNGSNAPDGGDPWVVPATGLINLNFFTTDSGGGGTQLPSEGFGNNYLVLIPEPSTYLLISVGAIGLMFVYRRRAKSVA